MLAGTLASGAADGLAEPLELLGAPQLASMIAMQSRQIERASMVA